MYHLDLTLVMSIGMMTFQQITQLAVKADNFFRGGYARLYPVTVEGL